MLQYDQYLNHFLMTWQRRSVDEVVSPDYSICANTIGGGGVSCEEGLCHWAHSRGLAGWQGAVRTCVPWATLADTWKEYQKWMLNVVPCLHIVTKQS